MNTYIHTYIHIYIYIHIYVFMYVYIYMYISACICIYTDISGCPSLLAPRKPGWNGSDAAEPWSHFSFFSWSFTEKRAGSLKTAR